MKSLLSSLAKPMALSLALWCLSSLPAAALTTNVSVINFSFNPPVVAISPGDKVTWNWSSGLTSHSTTRTNVWDSGLHPSPFTFSRTFNTAGNFPYLCTLHPFMTGSVNVQSPNTPPTVSLLGPTNNSVFAAPWTGTLQADASDSDGTVTSVEFFAGTTLLGAAATPGSNPSFTVTNLAAGTYTLTAVATDNNGAKTTSAGAVVQVLEPGSILLSSPQRIQPNGFQFSYSATPGLWYIIRRSTDLGSGFQPVATNPASGTVETFLDPAATGDFGAYSVQLQPNP